jgi:glycosyltransferase involved in cell wall biosynthesis
MASGCVPVTSQAGAWPWIISPAYGVRVETGMAEPLVEALDRLTGDPSGLARMAAEARRIAVQQYAIEKEVSLIHDLYAKLSD